MKKIKGHKTQLDGFKEEMFYESGVVVTMATRTLKNREVRNPTRRPKNE